MPVGAMDAICKAGMSHADEWRIHDECVVSENVMAFAQIVNLVLAVISLLILAYRFRQFHEWSEQTLTDTSRSKWNQLKDNPAFTPVLCLLFTAGKATIQIISSILRITFPDVRMCLDWWVVILNSIWLICYFSGCFLFGILFIHVVVKMLRTTKYSDRVKSVLTNAPKMTKYCIYATWGLMLFTPCGGKIFGPGEANAVIFWISLAVILILVCSIDVYFIKLLTTEMDESILRMAGKNNQSVVESLQKSRDRIHFVYILILVVGYPAAFVMVVIGTVPELSTYQSAVWFTYLVTTSNFADYTFAFISKPPGKKRKHSHATPDTKMVLGTKSTVTLPK